VTRFARPFWPVAANRTWLRHREIGARDPSPPQVGEESIAVRFSPPRVGSILLPRLRGRSVRRTGRGRAQRCFSRHAPLLPPFCWIASAIFPGIPRQEAWIKQQNSVRISVQFRCMQRNAGEGVRSSHCRNIGTRKCCGDGSTMGKRVSSALTDPFDPCSNSTGTAQTLIT
jgi:hypothetical protein